jgi:hypothetical protein
MGTSNFRRMKDFNLYILKDEVLYAVKDDGEIDYDLVDNILLNDIRYDMELLNESFKYYKIELLDGYYSGIQLYVEQVDEPSNETELIQERELMKATLKKLADNFGFIHLRVVGTFSNGETIYEISKENN